MCIDGGNSLFLLLLFYLSLRPSFFFCSSFSSSSFWWWLPTIIFFSNLLIKCQSVFACIVLCVCCRLFSLSLSPYRSLIVIIIIIIICFVSLFFRKNRFRESTTHQHKPIILLWHQTQKMFFRFMSRISWNTRCWSSSSAIGKWWKRQSQWSMLEINSYENCSEILFIGDFHPISIIIKVGVMLLCDVVVWCCCLSVLIVYIVCVCVYLKKKIYFFEIYTNTHNTYIQLRFRWFKFIHYRPSTNIRWWVKKNIVFCI